MIFWVILDHPCPKHAPLKSDIIYGRSLDDLSLLSSILSHLNLSKWAWLFNVCPCFCVGEVLYFFTFHWLLLPLTFLWVTPHTAEPLWEFFPTLWSHNTTAWSVVFYIKFVYSEKAKKFCEIFTLLLTTVHSQKKGEDFARFFGLFSIYEL